MGKLFGIPMHSLATFLLVVVGVILLALLRLGWRNRVLLWLGLRNIPRRRAQTTLIVFGLMLSTLIIAAAFGSFSIAAALLLIFLIFVMLAAERQREMGMARAIGTRRRHLIQMFLFEGTAYDLLAAAVGALLGAGVGLATVGSASIGIISTRAVVERRQQIGVLRAIGYRPWMIRWSFLLEASFVALLGICIGIGLGLILAYNFFSGEIASSGPGMGFSFVIPWTTLGIVATIAYAMSLLTTYLPSWQAARIYPAEALRYE